MILEYAVGEDVGDTLDDLREELQAALTEHKGHPGLRSPDGRKALEDIRDSIERRSVAHASAALPTTPRGPGGTSNAGSGLKWSSDPGAPDRGPGPSCRAGQWSHAPSSGKDPPWLPGGVAGPGQLWTTPPSDPPITWRGVGRRLPSPSPGWAMGTPASWQTTSVSFGATTRMTPSMSRAPWATYGRMIHASSS